MARAKQFDEDTVLLKAMKLFWEQGYERTSMQDLVEHMGVHKRSMYDTYGDKHSLYVRALNRVPGSDCEADVGGGERRPLHEGSDTRLIRNGDRSGGGIPGGLSDGEHVG